MGIICTEKYQGSTTMIFVFLFLISASLCSGRFDMWSFQQDLRHYEGVRYDIYPDPLHGASHATVGVGHLLIPGDKHYGQPIGTRISYQDLMTYLNKDSANALRDARRLYPGVFDSLPSEVQLIIADMSFNLGYSRLSRFRKMKAAVLKRDWDTAADEMVDSAWYGQVGRRSRDLVRRMRSVR